MQRIAGALFQAQAKQTARRQNPSILMEHYAHAIQSSSFIVEITAGIGVMRHAILHFLSSGPCSDSGQGQCFLLLRRIARTENEQRGTIPSRQPDLRTFETAIRHHAESAQPDKRQRGSCKSDRPRTFFQTLCT